MGLSKQAEDFVNQIAFMDEDMVVFMTGCPGPQARKVAFRAWMMVVTEVVLEGEKVLDKYDTPDDAVEAYAKAYMPECMENRERVRAAMAEDGLAPIKSAGQGDLDAETLSGEAFDSELAGERGSVGAA